MVPGSGTGLTVPLSNVAERDSPKSSPKITSENDSGLLPKLIQVKLTVAKVKGSG